MTEEIELVIKIPEESYKATCSGSMLPPDVTNVVNAIKNGTVLPKGHGRLKDTDKILDIIKHLRNGWNRYGNEYESGKYEAYDYALDEIMDAPTIIEADKAESEGEE